jgi:hypothetical protein
MNKNDERLKSLLKDWARDHELSAAKRKRMHAAVRLCTAEVVHERRAPRSLCRSVCGRLLYAGAGACLVLLVMLLIYGNQQEEGTRVTQRKEGPATGSRSELRESEVLYAELQRLFGRAPRWVASTADDVCFELAAESMDRDERPVLLQTVLAGRKVGETRWTPLWSAEVITRTEEYVAVNMNAERNARLTVWIHPNDDGTYVLDSEVQLEDPVSLVGVREQIVGEGKTARIHSESVGGTEYRIYQTVESLSLRKGVHAL